MEKPRSPELLRSLNVAQPSPTPPQASSSSDRSGVAGGEQVVIGWDIEEFRENISKLKVGWPSCWVCCRSSRAEPIFRHGLDPHPPRLL